MRLLAVDLRPRGPMHLGERGVGIEETAALAHSDTVFSALCWSWSLLFGERALGELLARFEHDPPFLISSAFPRAGPVRFLPRPLALPAVLEEDEGRRRALRRVEFVSWSVFEALAEGRLPEGELLLAQGQRLWATEGELEAIPEDEEALADFLRQWADLGHIDPPALRERAHCRRLWATAELPHVTLDRVSSASEVFQEGVVAFEQGCGFFLLIRLRDPRLREELLAALRLLGEEGLGGRRSTGRGRFELEGVQEVDVPEASGGERALLLSLLNPKAEELPRLVGAAGVAWRLVVRRGWTFSATARNLWRRPLAMCGEGSVLRRPEAELVGRMVPVLRREGDGVPHDVWRYGWGLWVPWP